MAETQVQPLILFKSLKGFPSIDDDGKIETILFLEAARETVEQIAKFGKWVAPVVTDMNGNIEKLTQIHIETKTTYLHDMVQSNENVHALKAKDALLWLKRALQLIERFFSNILSDENQGENLKNHFHEAYRVTLSQYHNFIVRKLFAVVYGFLPQRSQLIGRDEVHVENVRLLDDFVRDMRLNLQQIDNIIAQ